MVNGQIPTSEAKMNDSDLEDLRIAYQTLPQMIAYEGQKEWNATSVFIQFSVALVAAVWVPLLAKDEFSAITGLIGLILSGIGLAASIIWYSFIRRYETITGYWVLSMKEIEEKLSPHLRAFQRGDRFASGEIVKVSDQSIGYHGVARLPARHGLLIIYSAFFVIFLSSMIIIILKLIGIPLPI